MISSNLYLNIVMRVILMVCLSLLLGFLVMGDQSVRLSLLCALSLVFLVFNLISYLNTANKKIRFFFDSVRNEDSSLSFPGDKGDKTLNGLYESMNRVNHQIKQLRIENRQQEQYFQILLEHLATGIITYNDRGFILHANSSAKRLLSAEVLTHLSQIGRTDPKLYQIIKGIKPFERKLIAVNNGYDEIQLSLKATSFRANDHEMVILSIQDIKNELDEKEVESWMKLIRVLMHEIMNSITPITSLSESLLHMYSSEGRPIHTGKVTGKTIATTLQGLNVIREQGKGLMSFVESYRKLTRVPEPDKKLFKIEDLMTRIRILFDSIEESQKISFVFSIKDPGMEIFADQNLISQALLNLIKNAIEANENNCDGKIMIISGIDNNNRPEICVVDNGPGIEEENIDEIFVPFFTTKQSGSGIGLSISRQIMRVHGGTLKARSVPGKETIFCLTF